MTGGNPGHQGDHALYAEQPDRARRLQHQQVIDFIDSLPDHIMIVIDEAYVEFVSDPTGLRGLGPRSGGRMSWLLRTFSKAYGLAGSGSATAWPMLVVAAPYAPVSLPFGGVDRCPGGGDRIAGSRE